MQLKKISINNNVILYRLGHPIKTGAVIADTNAQGVLVSSIDGFDMCFDEGKLVLQKKLASSEKIYGLGEAMGSLNKRSQIVRCFNNDEPNHTPDIKNLYGSHPFVIFDDNLCVGLFIDYPGEINFDFGFTDYNTAKASVSPNEYGEVNTDVYIITGKSKTEIIHNLLLIIGVPYFPPKWAFGYHQSRWSYPTSGDVKDICKMFRHLDIPCDAIYLDLDYMDDYKVFTTSSQRFPNFANFVKELKDNGFHLVPIVDPGVKVEEGYDVYEEGKKGGYFCKSYDYETHAVKDEDFVGTVWPGRTSFPDFLNVETRSWWGDLYRQFCEIGVNSFWNDMNEPAIFFTKRGLNDLYECYDEVRSRPNPGLDFFDLKDKATGLSNNGEDYKSFAHNIDGHEVCHIDVHNLFGFNMCLASSNGLKKHSRGQRYFLLSRSSYMGQHRFSAVWTGDNKSWWEHILLHIRMVQSMNMCGFFFVGPDIPGFGANADSQLLIRWLQVGVFTPFLRNHCALFCRNQEPWAFDQTTTNIARNLIKFRYAMLGYIYSEFHNSIVGMTPFVMPMSFAFDEEALESVDDQYMFGGSIMAAPIYTQNAFGRMVYLPSCKWLAWSMTEHSDRNLTVYDSGTYFIKSDLSKTVFFIKENSMLPLHEPLHFANEKVITELTVIAFVTSKATFYYYQDDGETEAHSQGEYGTLALSVTRNGDDYSVGTAYSSQSDFANQIKHVTFEIYNENGRWGTKTVNL